MTKDNVISVEKTLSYIPEYNITGIDDLQNLLEITGYCDDYFTFEQTKYGETLSCMIWQGHIESIAEDVEGKVEKTKEERELLTLLNSLLEAMRTAGVEFILVDRS